MQELASTKVTEYLLLVLDKTQMFMIAAGNVIERHGSILTHRINGLGNHKQITAGNLLQQFGMTENKFFHFPE